MKTVRGTLPKVGRVRRGIATVGCGVLAALASVSPGAAAVGQAPAPEDPFKVVAKFPVLSPRDRNLHPAGWWVTETTLALNPIRRRAFQLYKLDSERRIGIRSFDLDSLKPLAYTTFTVGEDVVPEAWGKGSGGDWLYTQDELSGRIFLASRRRALVSPLTEQVTFAPGEVTVVDEQRAEAGKDPVVARLTLPDASASSVARRYVEGISFFRDRQGGEGKLLLWLGPRQPQAAGVNLPLVVQQDVATGAIDWELSLDGCRAGTPIAFFRTWVPVVRSLDGTSIYTFCNVSWGLGSVVRIPLTEGRPDVAKPVTFSASVPWVREAFADPKSGRVLMASEVPGGLRLWAYDANAARFVGVSGFRGATPAYGFDPAAGRIYALRQNFAGAVDPATGQKSRPERGGLYIADWAITPPTQPSNVMPELAWPAQTAMKVDPASGARPRRIFLRRAALSEKTFDGQFNENPDDMRTYPEGKLVSLWDEQFYLVVEDRLPPSEEESLEDLDRLTVDAPEKPGRTDVTFDVTGSSYGLRSRFLAGATAAVRSGDLNLDVLTKAGTTQTPCGQTDRELTTAKVEEVRLTDLQANASAKALDIDSASRADLQQPSERCAPSSAPSEVPWKTADGLVGRSWDDKSTSCVGDGSEDSGGSADGVSHAHTKTACVLSQGDASAESSFDALVSSTVKVGATFGTTTMSKKPDGGTHVVSEAVARGVEIGDVKIDLVFARAEVNVNGRPQDKPATFTRFVCGVRAPGFVREPCGDPAPLISAMNQRLSGRAEVRLTDPDPAMLNGSPGGYVAGITKHELDAFNDRLVHRDVSLEVPGLTVIVYRDTAGEVPGRHIVQLAGVRAAATYGIQCVYPYSYDRSAHDCRELAPDGDGGAEIPPAHGQAPESDLGEQAPRTLGPDESEGSGGSGPLPTLKAITGFLMRSFSDGLLAAAVWFLFGLPLLVASRRFALTRTLQGDR